MNTSTKISFFNELYQVFFSEEDNTSSTDALNTLNSDLPFIELHQQFTNSILELTVENDHHVRPQHYEEIVDR